ncbi:hypothetical protein K0H71_20775, partial [Bacillus sp. IITD106]|nr:hypothetical protein [Bacillus sp. IITD106]
KLLILLLSICLLAACTSQKEVGTQANNNEKDKVEVTQPSEQEDNQNNESGSTEVPDKQLDDSTTTGTEQTDYIELSIVFNKIGNNEYEQVVETDNSNKRVILFEDQNHHKKFKSIYIKHDNRLKVIDLANNELILNEIL